MVVMTVLHGLAAAFAIVAVSMVYERVREKKRQGN
jgi:predicted outer membrane lipoprotein